jgi:hypothetical protein
MYRPLNAVAVHGFGEQVRQFGSHSEFIRTKLKMVFAPATHPIACGARDRSETI